MGRFKINGFTGEPAPAGDDPIYRGEGMMHFRALDRKTRRRGTQDEHMKVQVPLAAGARTRPNKKGA